jgi:nucleotide-binding universal stress UspA family protein
MSQTFVLQMLSSTQKRSPKKAGESLSDGSVSTNVARGSTIEECVAQLEFDDNEIVLVGSSRLASRRRLFIGSVASKMLRVLPVPMVVVPRDYEEPGV